MGSGLYLLGSWFSQFYSLRSDSWFKLLKLSVHFSADFPRSSWRICIRAGRPVSIAISREADRVRRGLHFNVNICGEQMKCSFGPGLKIACLSDEEFHYISACSFSQLCDHWGKKHFTTLSLSTPSLNTIAVSGYVLKGIERFTLILHFFIAMLPNALVKWELKATILSTGWKNALEITFKTKFNALQIAFFKL